VISSLAAMLELAQRPGTALIARIPAPRMLVGNVPAGVAPKSSALTINRAIGSRIKRVRIGQEQFNVRLWASSAAEAESHYLALAATWRERFNVHLPSGALLYSVDVGSPGSHLSDPDTGWPFVLVSVEATFSEETVSG
jgi:hypothetical protein